MATSQAAKVPSLGTQSFYAIVQHLWKTSGVISKFIEHIHLKMSENLPANTLSKPKDQEYSEKIDQIAAEILTWDFLPRPTILKLGNCFLDHDKNMRAFITSLALSLTELTRENIEICVKKIVVTPAGYIDKKKSIIELAVYPEKEILFTKRFTAHHCVGLLDVVQRILNDPVELERLDADPSAVRLYPNSFIEPSAFWESKSHIMGMGDKYLQYLAIHGSLESLEYFLRRLPVEHRQKELAQAAMWTLADITPAVDKFIFIYHHLEESSWTEFLRRNFFTIFTTFLSSRRYRHMCTVFYYQVLDTMDTKTINCLFAYLSVQSSSESSSSVHDELFGGELDVIVSNIWRMTPRKHKEAFGINLFRNLVFFSNRGLNNIIAGILEDPIFKSQDRTEMLSCVVINYIIFDRLGDISNLFSKLNLDCNWIFICDLLTESNIRSFILYGDNCRHIELYDKLLSYKLIRPTADLHTERAKIFTRKVNLLESNDFLDKLFKAIVKGVMSFEDLHSLVCWSFSEKPYSIRRFYINRLLPNKGLTLDLKYQLINFHSNNYLKRIMQNEFQLIKLSITQDREVLFHHCAEFIHDFDIKSLQRMFRSIFETTNDIVTFMDNFYESDIGAETVYNIIIQDTYDVNYYMTFEFQMKLKKIIRFREDFVLNDEMAIKLGGILQRIGHPNSASFGVQLQPRSSVSLLPHESVADMRVIADAHYRMFRATLCSHDFVEIITNSILARYNMLQLSLTELSIEYEIEAGINVPIVL